MTRAFNGVQGGAGVPGVPAGAGRGKGRSQGHSTPVCQSLASCQAQVLSPWSCHRGGEWGPMTNKHRSARGHLRGEVGCHRVLSLGMG